jgi:S1-C subfamily serine protease
MHQNSGRYAATLVCTALILALLSFTSCEREKRPPQPALSQPEQKAPSAPESPRSSISAVTSYADAVERVGAGVVTIRAARRARAPRQHPFFDDPVLREFFGGKFGSTQPRGPAVQLGLGSGVIVNSNGTILTNHHVIDGAEAIQVQLTNNRVFDAKLLGSDPPSDLAVLLTGCASATSR